MGPDYGCKKAFWNSRDVAKLLDVTARTVCMWAECGEIPAVRVGRQWRFRPADLNAWLGRMANSSTTAAALREPVGAQAGASSTVPLAARGAASSSKLTSPRKPKGR